MAYVVDDLKTLKRRGAMKTISCALPDSLAAALQQRMDADKETGDHIVARALSEYLATPLHTLFQVSTSAALVEGNLSRSRPSLATSAARGFRVGDLH